jgi:hypothetical protein
LKKAEPAIKASAFFIIGCRKQKDLYYVWVQTRRDNISTMCVFLRRLVISKRIQHRQKAVKQQDDNFEYVEL